jgi:signal transduction histidine kinase/CheY-like chemotaxis protein
MSHDPRDFDALSREFCIACTCDGVVTWRDARAKSLLDLEAGARLDRLATPGTEGKLAALLAVAAHEDVRDWEAPLVIDGRPVTVSFNACPKGGEVLLAGHLVAQHFASALEQLSGSMAEVVGLNREIATQKKELQARHDEAVRLHRELAESHQGVLTMHAELEDRAVELSHSAELKSRIVAQVGHEFRTPLHSIMGLSRLLLDGIDGDLNDEQSRQVGFIRTSAEELMQFVDDLLDLSRADAGKTALRMESFGLRDFVASMRGMLRPLLDPATPVDLVFSEPPDAVVETDRAKVSQVVRNLVSNALKFTERGEVRVSARLQPGGLLAIAVSDTGIGIEPENLERVFEEFGQVATPLHDKVKGTGLGLPLARRLAHILGGTLEVQSTPGLGSTFTLLVPTQHPEAREMEAMVERSRKRAPGRGSVLVVEDDRKTLFVYEKYLVMAGFHVLPARTIEDAQAIIDTTRPAAIVLDVMLEGETSWSFLAQLKAAPETRDIPVLVVTVTNREQKARALGADEFWLKPLDQDRLVKRLRALTRSSLSPRVLVIDDDERARYIVRKHLAGERFEVSEAATGPEGVAIAQQLVPHVILLDFLLEEMTAFDVLDELKSDPRTRGIPVIVVTSQALDESQQRRLMEEAEAVISKQNLSRELALSRIRDALVKSGVAV